MSYDRLESPAPDQVLNHVPKKRKKHKRSGVSMKKKMTELVEMRWDATRADEGSIRHRYREDLTVEDALAELAKLRRLCEMAATEINQRLNPQDQKCASCGRPMDPRRPPTMTEPMRDPATGTYYNNFYCSILCVQKRNKLRLGREDLIK